MAISKENTRIQVTIPKKLKEQIEEKAKLENRSSKQLYCHSDTERPCQFIPHLKRTGDFLAKLVKRAGATGLLFYQSNLRKYFHLRNCK